MRYGSQYIEQGTDFVPNEPIEDRYPQELSPIAVFMILAFVVMAAIVFILLLLLGGMALAGNMFHHHT